jgi:hypothetical protein
MIPPILFESRYEKAKTSVAFAFIDAIQDLSFKRKATLSGLGLMPPIVPGDYIIVNFTILL